LQVLRFYGYYKESVPESPLETFRVRKVVLCMYVVDETLEVSEPREDNSGLAQGLLLKRHRVPKSAAAMALSTLRGAVAEEGKDGEGAALGGGGAGRLGGEEDGYFGWRDLCVGSDITLYGRRIRVVGADAFTRDWYVAQGAPQGPSEEVPLDEAAARRAYAEAELPGPHAARGQKKRLYEDKVFMEASRGKFLRDPERRRQWEEHDGEVLQFDCVWHDDRAGGDTRHFVLEYFVADDEVRVLEAHAENSGRDQARTLLKKQALPKDWKGMSWQIPGHESAVHGPSVRHDVLVESGYLPREPGSATLRGGAVHEYLKAQDLEVGRTVNVFGRVFHVRGCSAATRRWYRENLGREQPRATYAEPTPEEHPRLPVPPHIPAVLGVGQDFTPTFSGGVLRLHCDGPPSFFASCAVGVGNITARVRD
jgi:hypothetical protein